MACPICGRVLCDHSPAERGQSHEEMMADYHGMSVEEYKKRTNPLASTEEKSKEEKERASEKK